MLPFLGRGPLHPPISEFLNSFLTGTLPQLGWLLVGAGIATFAVWAREEIVQRRRRRQLLAWLESELDETRYRVVIGAFGLALQVGKLTAELATWAKPIVAVYRGIQANPYVATLVFQTAGLSDDQIARHTEKHRLPDDRTLREAKLDTPVLDLALTELKRLGDARQRLLLEIKTQVSFINAIADQQQEFYELTFRGLTETSHNQAVANLSGTYDQILSRSKYLAAFIEAYLAADDSTPLSEIQDRLLPQIGWYPRFDETENSPGAQVSPWDFWLGHNPEQR